MPAKFILRAVTFAIIAAALCNYNARADNWERFRGPNGTGVASDKNIPIEFGKSKHLRWKTPVPGVGNSSPVVWGDRVFLQSAGSDGTSRTLYCFDAKSGKEVWNRSIKASKPDKSIYSGRPDSSYANASAATDGQAVYIPFWNGKDIVMTAYDFKGEQLWQRNLGEFVSQHGPGASPMVYKDLLIFSLDKDATREVADPNGKKDAKGKTITKKVPVPNPSTLYALDTKTGKSVWEVPREAIRACYSMPFILERQSGEPELMVTSTSAVTSYDPLTGKANWYWTWSFPKDPLRTIAASTFVNDMLLSCSGDGSGPRFMAAVTLKGKGKETKGEQAWINDKKFPYVTSPLVRDGLVFFVNDTGYAGCFDPKDGKEIWFERLPGAKFYASPVMIDGKIYAATESGDVHIIEASPKYQLLATNSLGEQILATPAVSNGALFIRTKSHLYCFAAN
jgi:outer membrane protein assembly factor BamB